MAIQRNNVAGILSSMPTNEGIKDIYIFDLYKQIFLKTFIKILCYYVQKHFGIFQFP